MALTVTEKEDWKERISRRIDQAIKSLCAAEDPGFIERVRQVARDRAIEALKLADFEKRVAEIARQIYEELSSPAERGGIDEVFHMDALKSWLSFVMERELKHRKEVYERNVLGETQLGRRVLQLREEKEELLDTVWDATSEQQIRELWQRVTELLSREPTPLQAQALQIEPTDRLPE
jgi:hypothetical protein